MFFGRFIIIILKKKLKKETGDKEGEALNINKKITKKFFDNRKRNPVEVNKSKQSEGSERTITEIRKPSKASKKRKATEDEEES